MTSKSRVINSSESQRDEPSFNSELRAEVADSEPIVCPVCGAIAVQEKCKIICRSQICRGRVIMNCSEF